MTVARGVPDTEDDRYKYCGQKRRGFMQVVVVKAPKMLKGLIRVIFRMKKPEKIETL